MKPAWDQLGSEFKDSKSVIIGDVDCTVEKDLCSKHGVRGYPTIKYYNAGGSQEGEKYEGGRDFDALKEFASKNLGPTCGPKNMDLCDDEQKAKIEELQKMSAEDRAAAIKVHEDAIEEAEKTFKSALEELQATYEKISKEKDATISKHKTEVGPLKQVHAAASA